MRDDDDDGRVALVTGASGAIGGAVSELLESEGWTVIRHGFRGAPATRGWIVADFGRPEAIQTFAERVSAILEDRRLSLVVHCAGAYVNVPNPTFRECEELARVNVIAPYLLTLELRRFLRAPACVVFVSSIASRRATPPAEFYGATKAAVDSLVGSLAYKLGPSSIRVVGVAPGLVQSSMSEEIWRDAERIESYRRKIPRGQHTTAEEIARLTVLLASAKAGAFTGHVIPADAGAFLSFGQDIDDSKYALEVSTCE